MVDTLTQVISVPERLSRSLPTVAADKEQDDKEKHSDHPELL